MVKLVETKSLGGYGKVYRRMWTDAVFRQLSRPQPCAQHLWLYLLCGPKGTAMPGILITNESDLAEGLKWSLEGLRQGFRELFEVGMVKVDWDAGLVWLVNAYPYNRPENQNVVTGWRTPWAEVPECSLKLEIWQSLREYTALMGKKYLDEYDKWLPEPSLKGIGNGIGNGSVDGYKESLVNRNPNQEQEQEQEQKQEKALPPTASGGGFKTREELPSGKPDAAPPQAPVGQQLVQRRRPGDPPQPAVTDPALWVLTPAWREHVAAQRKACDLGEINLEAAAAKFTALEQAKLGSRPPRNLDQAFLAFALGEWDRKPNGAAGHKPSLPVGEPEDPTYEEIMRQL